MELLSSPTMNRLVVEIPVRHGKSVYCSHLLPCWLMLTRPNRNVWVLTYGSDFAQEFGSRNLDLMEAQSRKLTGLRLHPKFSRRDHFRMAPPFTGEFRGLGIYGGLAGKGAHVIIADDLIKEFSEIATEEARERIWSRFHGEVLNRLEPGAKMLVIMSRRHPDDLIGRLKALNAQLAPEKQWHSITFPALDDDNIALWPERYPAEELLGIKRELELAGTPWVWGGLYQQDAASCSELTEWPASYWKEPFYYPEKPDFKPVFKLLALDPSMGKDKQVGDFQALLYSEVDREGTLWVDDPILVRVPLTQLEDLSCAMLDQHKPDAFAIETNNFQELVATNISAKRPTAPIWAYNQMRAEAKHSGAGKGKEVDIRMLLTPILSRHQVRIRDTPQGRLLGNQLRDFPIAKYDDGPDALALTIRLWNDLMFGRGQTPNMDQAISTV